MGMPVLPLFDYDGFRVRDNVTDPSGVNAAFDGGDTALNTDWTQTVDELFRFRSLIKQTEAALEASDNVTELLLQYENNTAAAGVWNAVGAVGGGTEDVDFVSATGFADGDNTTQILGAGTFVTGDGMEVAGASDTITFLELQTTETDMEVSVIINGSQVTDGDVINFRWLYSAADESPPATTFNAATNSPSITVDKPVGVGMLNRFGAMRGGISGGRYGAPLAGGMKL